MKNRCFHILVMALLVACVGCSPKAKQTIEPSQVIVTSYPSSIGEAGVAVYLPEGYTTSEKDYPVLYLLHGSGDDETGWLTKGQAKSILDSLIASNLCQQMIVVMPNGYLEQTGNTIPPNHAFGWRVLLRRTSASSSRGLKRITALLTISNTEL